MLVRLTKLSVLALSGSLVAGLAACGSSKKTTGAGASSVGSGTTSSTAASSTSAASSTTAAGTSSTAAASTSSSAAAGAGECGGVLDSIKKLDGVAFTPANADTLTVVTSLPGPAFWTGGDTIGDINGGFEYCMAKGLQKLLGVSKFQDRNEDFQAITTGAVSGYDLALSQISVTDDRKKVVDFTDQYFTSDQSFIVKKGKTVKTLADAKALAIGAQTGTTGEDFVDNTLKPTKAAQKFKDLNGAYTALDAGQVDAVIMDTAINLGQAKTSKSGLEVPVQFHTGDVYAGIVPKGSKNLPAINAALKALIDGGYVAKLEPAEFGTDPQKIPYIDVPKG
jgi:polar amino acid transport system substrate-binding protein